MEGTKVAAIQAFSPHQGRQVCQQVQYFDQNMLGLIDRKYQRD